MISLTCSHHRPSGPFWRPVVVALSLLALAACGEPTPAETPPAVPQPTGAQVTPTTALAAPSATAAPTSAPTATPPPTATPEPIPVFLAPSIPDDIAEGVRHGLEEWAADPTNGTPRALQWVEAGEDAQLTITLAPLAAADPSTTFAERYYAVVVPFDTLTDDVSLDDLSQRYVGVSSVGILYVTPESKRALHALLGGDTHAAQVVPADEMLAHLQKRRDAMGVLPFERIDPRFKVLAVDGANALSNTLDPAAYPLAAAAVAAGPAVADAAAIPMDALTAAVASTNRDPSRLTTLIMTGVTAMSRLTAARMEAMGYTYPAEIIADTLSAADITHVSNEVPFIEGCRVDTSENNLTLCSDYTYWAALDAIGTDIVGLSGNHVNDFGRDGARESIQFYRDRDIPIYGSGLNVGEACTPLMWEHNGNTFAFLAALAFDPSYAWASETEPGACYFYDHKDAILRSITDLSREVGIVAVELQYLETYQPYPTDQQVAEFRELRQAGADIVTGVQSHVPQAMEPYGFADPGGPGIIVYGLGNLFFDQMWSWETRTELYARHTIYDGRVLGTEILTGVLEDYAQPRWATNDERLEILQRIFDAAPPRPSGGATGGAAAVATEWKEHEEPGFGVRLTLPASWEPVPGYERRYGGDDGWVQFAALGGEGLSIGEACTLESQHKLEPYGSTPTIEMLTISGQQACRIRPSDDQPEAMEGQAGLVVVYPEPVEIDGQTYGFLLIWADVEHIARIAESVTLVP
jgi:predicted small lipoprotein YifL